MKLPFLRPVVILWAAVALLMTAVTMQPAAAAIQPAARSAALLSSPNGCPSGAVCFYRRGNGGDLCGIWYGNAPTLGACANIGQSGSIFNNGQSCNGCQDVKLYWGSSYSGAYYCLPKGSYLLYIEQNTFNAPNSQASGYGQTLAYRPGLPNGPGGVASAKWTSC
jgi:hypothetical protein